jgi:Carboxypeptidase regulatory-like domain
MRLSVIAWGAVFLTMGAYAQLATTTALVGTVTDTTGQIVPGAKITAINTGTGDTYNATTNDRGYYNIQFVRPGNYEIDVQKAGFQKFKKAAITVETNQIVRNDVTLQIGSVSQSVVVEASAPVIKTDDASVSELVTSRQVADLPLNGRDPMHLAITTPGVVPGLKGTNGVPPGEDFIGAGTREIQNEMSLDGISIMNNLITTTPSRPMVEAVQEVQVQTGTYSAQYGAYLGVHINMITKSGTNAIHGSVLEFVRNDDFDARPFFLPATKAKPPLRQNQFGFELDGPIIIPKLYNGKNKTFFMGSYEGLRQIRATTSLATVLTPQMFTGDFSQYTAKQIVNPANGQAFPGNIIPSSQLSPYTVQLQKYYPTPNLPGVTNNYSAVLANNNNTDQTVDRLDQNIGDKTRVFFRYQRQWESLLVGSANPTAAVTSPVYLSNFDIGYTQTFTPTLVNDMRFGRNYFNSDTLSYFAVNNLTDAGTSLGIPSFNGDTTGNNPGIPEFNVTGFTGWGNAGTNWYQDDSTWQGTEQISWNKGTHNIMAGAEFRKLETGRAATNSPRGYFSFTGQFSGYAPADFILGLPASLQTPAVQYRGLVAEWRDGFFVLDNWQVSRKLTVNYGLRYELPTVPYTVNGVATELNAQQTAIVPANPPVKGFEFTYPQHTDWAPRLGFAYRLNESTVLRGGFGIYYNPNQTNSQTFLNGNPPFVHNITYTSLPTTPTLSLSNPTGGAANPAPPVPNMITDNWNLATPRMNQWSFGVERAMWRNAGLEVEYLGSHSYHLDRSYYNNTPYLPGPGAIQPRRPNQLFGVIRTIQDDEIANYEGMSAVLRQRFARGVQFLASYTWSHTLDASTDSNGGGTPMNPYQWRLDYGNASWDIRHRFVASYLWEIPFFKGASNLLRNAFGNWQINGITTLQTGMPFNVTYGTDTANTSSSGSNRPNLVAAPSADCGDGHLVGCINPAAFAIPALYNYGNAGRNLLAGPHLFTTDLSLFKNFQIHERARFELRFEAFNVTNSPEFSNPNASFNTGAFGTITSTSIDNREIQLGAKLLW